MRELKVPVVVVVGWSTAAATEALRGLGPAEEAAAVACEAQPGLRTVVGPERVAERSLSCPCCVARLDVRDGLRRLLARRDPPQRIAVVAGRDVDAGPLLATLLADLQLVRRAELVGVLAALDGPEAAARLATGGSVAPDRRAGEHLAVADGVVLARVDRLTPAGRRQVEAALRDANPYIPVWKSGSRWWPAPHLDGGAYDLAAVARRLDSLVPGPGPSGFALVDAHGEAEPEDLRAWARDLLDAHRGRLLRVQAVASVRGTAQRWALSAVRTTSSSGICGPSPGGPPRARVLAVGEGLDAAELACSLGEVLSSQ